MRWWSSKNHSVTVQTLDSAAFLQLHFYLALPPHNLFYLFIDRSFRFSLPPYLSPISPHISPVDAASLSLCTRFSPPISPGTRATVHLDGAPSCRTPLLVYDFLPFWAAQGFPCASLCLPYLVRLPPVAVFDLRNQVHVGPRIIPSRGHFIPLPASTIHTPAPPPLPALAGGPVPSRSLVVASCYSFPRPLCFRLQRSHTY